MFHSRLDRFFNIFSTLYFNTHSTVTIWSGDIEFSRTYPRKCIFREGNESNEAIEWFFKTGPKAFCLSFLSNLDEDLEKDRVQALRLYQANPIVLRIECSYDNDDWWESILSSIPPSVEYLDLTRTSMDLYLYRFIPETVHSLRVPTETPEVLQRTGMVHIQVVDSSSLVTNCRKLVIERGPRNLSIKGDNLEVLEAIEGFDLDLDCPNLKHLNCLKTKMVSVPNGLKKLMCKKLTVSSPVPSLKMLWCQTPTDTSFFPNLKVYETSDEQKCFDKGAKLSSLSK